MWSRREGMTSLRGRSAPVRRIGGGGVSQARPGCSARATRGKRCAPRRAAVHTVGRDATARDWGVVSQRAARARVRVPLQAGDLIDRWSEGDRALSASGTGWRSAGARTWTWPRRVRARGAGRDRVTGLGRPTSRGPTFAPQPAGRQSSPYLRAGRDRRGTRHSLSGVPRHATFSHRGRIVDGLGNPVAVSARTRRRPGLGYEPQQGR